MKHKMHLSRLLNENPTYQIRIEDETMKSYPVDDVIVNQVNKTIYLKFNKNK